MPIILVLGRLVEILCLRENTLSEGAKAKQHKKLRSLRVT